jgi:hypothetical protein
MANVHDELCFGRGHSSAAAPHCPTLRFVVFHRADLDLSLSRARVLPSFATKSCGVIGRLSERERCASLLI